MKLTREEALRLIDEGATEEPAAGALDRVLNHDWSFDPRGSQLTLLLRRFHEQDQVLYGTWSGFEKQLVFPVIEGPYPLRCVLCAASISSAPYFTAFNHTGYRWEICCSCVAAMGGRVSSSSSVVRIVQSMDRPHVALPRAFTALCKTLRRFFR